MKCEAVVAEKLRARSRFRLQCYVRKWTILRESRRLRTVTTRRWPAPIGKWQNLRQSPCNCLSIGFSKLFAGNFIRATGPAMDPTYFYSQYTFRV
ncbi:MAG: hypothetical protein JWM11_6638 [Planctomycetaceae bacterium]|nr:hypothetical protein [Planctomycetaceae bacterium]